MRLGNDAVEGSAAKTLSEARRIADLLARNASSLRAKFSLSHEHSARPQAALPEEFRRQLADVFGKYFEMREALATDQADKALVAAGGMQQALAVVSGDLLTGRNRQAWAELSAGLSEILSGASRAKDIEATRRAFALLSEQLLAVARQFGPGGRTELYELKCPMAFNNRGAMWLQQDEKTRNPYFGAAMLRCGSVVGVIPAQADGETGDRQHE